jgi:hypothetical protein
MNYLIGSAFVSDQNPFPDNVTSGPFDWIVFDEPAGELALQLVDLGTNVVGRHVFYNRSAFDGNNAGANAADDAAIATDKWALAPDHTAVFPNYTSYFRGINGVMVDIAGLPTNTNPTAADFTFRVGNNNDPAGWTTLTTTALPTVTVRRGAGVAGSDRVTLTWPDNVVRKQWLQVTVLPTVRTGIAAPEVFYFGNAVGDSGNSGADARVTPVDELGARSHKRTAAKPAPVDFHWDFNRDRRVNSADQLIARRNRNTTATDLNLISVPPIPVDEFRVASAAAARSAFRPGRDAFAFAWPRRDGDEQDDDGDDVRPE